jgi:hypothetical protein
MNQVKVDLYNFILVRWNNSNLTRKHELSILNTGEGMNNSHANASIYQPQFDLHANWMAHDRQFFMHYVDRTYPPIFEWCRRKVQVSPPPFVGKTVKKTHEWLTQLARGSSLIGLKNISNILVSYHSIIQEYNN